jgi:hypothetical protein
MRWSDERQENSLRGGQAGTVRQSLRAALCSTHLLLLDVFDTSRLYPRTYFAERSRAASPGLTVDSSAASTRATPDHEA